MTVLNEAQQERLKEITANLRHIRQEKSILLEEIAMQTHIRLHLLEALEEWRFEELPEAIFVQGFIRRYADRLGLDGTAIANSFPINNYLPLKLNNSNTKLSLNIPLFVPYIFLLVAASIGLFYLLNPKFTSTSLAKKQDPTPSFQQKAQPSPISPVSTTSVASSTIKATSLPKISPTTNSSINVAITLELQGLSWLQVKADGKTEFEGTLSKGESKTWTAKKSLTVRSGNAGAVLVSVNEQQPKLLGNEGQVKEVTYTN